MAVPSEGVGTELERARAAFAERRWDEARAGFKAVPSSEMTASDLSAWGDAAWWLGDIDEALGAYEGAYRASLQEGLKDQAAGNAIGLAISLFLRGEEQLGAGWIGRAQRVLADEPEGVTLGYLLYLELESDLDPGDPEATTEKARQVQQLAERFDDQSLITAARVIEGRALLRSGDVRRGRALLDEAALSVLSDELQPEWAGNIYCHLMAAFYELRDVKRAAEWVESTQRWLDEMPAAVMFSGICRVHRSQVLQIKGAWDRAEAEAQKVCEELAAINVAAAAEGFYQVGELRRLKGDVEGAESAYAQAHERGRDPQPGLALLRLAQGRTEAALAAIAAALVAAGDSALKRAPLLAAYVEIAVASGALEVARGALAEFEMCVSRYRSSGLEATGATLAGLVTLAEADPAGALPLLRDACSRWRSMGAEHEAARTCLLLARTYSELGDKDSAARELDAAAAGFESLGAAPDLAAVAAERNEGGYPKGLSEREVEVLSLVARGLTNREVATSLTLSEKTIARHLANIFVKLDVSSRTEAAAFAFENGLVPRVDG